MIRLVVAALFAVVAAYGLGRWQGHKAGVEAERASAAEARQELQSELFEAGERLSRMAADLEQARRQANARAQDFEDAARAADDADRPCIGPDGVRRLEQLWGPPP
jgi:type II secretory pathway pseudopilin PulG